MSIKKIYLELTNKCNLNCRICYRQSWSEVLMDMEEDLLTKIYEDIQTIDISEIIFGGIGEPTYSKNIKKALRLFEQYNITLTTNGTIIDNELKELIAKNVKTLVVSIDGLNKAYEEIRGYDLNKVITNINDIMEAKKNLINSNLSLVVEFVATKNNIDEIFNVADLSASLGAQQLIVSNIIPQTEEYKDSILYHEDYDNKMKELFNKLRIYSFKKGIDLILPKYKITTERYCPFIESNSIVLGVDGNIYPCYRFSHELNEYILGRHKKIYKYSFGNIKNTSLLDLVNSKQYQSFKNTIYSNRYPSCFDCDFLDGCNIPETNDYDCYLLSPSCSDCLWSRRIAICP